MKRKYLKSMVAAALAASMTLSLCACGKTVRDGDGESESGKETKMEKTEYTLSECFSKEGTNIWYYIEDDEIIGKDARIREVYIFNDGALMRYDGYGLKLGDVAKMSDEEIIAELENYHQSKVQEWVQEQEERISLAEEVLAQGYFDQPYEEEYYGPDDKIWIDVTGYKSEYEKYLEDLKAFDYNMPYQYGTGDAIKMEYEIAVFTDPTGNNTEKQAVRFDYHKATLPSPGVDFYRDETAGKIVLNYSSKYIDNYYGYDINGNHYRGAYILRPLDQIEQYPNEEDTSCTYEFTGVYDTTRGGFQVYDSNYGGYICEDWWACEGGSFITRLEKNMSFKLDDVRAEGILVDPEDAGFYEEP